MGTHKKQKPETEKPARQPIEREDTVQQIQSRLSATPRSDDGAQLPPNSPAHNEDECGPLMQTLGIANRDFVKQLSRQLFRASVRGVDRVDDGALFFSLSVLTGKKAMDELDAMLLVQMAAVHTAAMRTSGELACAEDPSQRDSAARRLTQLNRTFAAQLEARKRYISGEPRVTVQNVSVTEGGQAIVGNVTQACSTPAQAVENPASAQNDPEQTAQKNHRGTESDRVAVSATGKFRVS